MLSGRGWWSISGSKQTQGAVHLLGCVKGSHKRGAFMCKCIACAIAKSHCDIIHGEPNLPRFLTAVVTLCLLGYSWTFQLQSTDKQKLCCRNSQPTSEHPRLHTSTSTPLFTQLKVAVTIDKCPDGAINRDSLTFSSVFPGKSL